MTAGITPTRYVSFIFTPLLLISFGTTFACAPNNERLQSQNTIQFLTKKEVLDYISTHHKYFIKQGYDPLTLALERAHVHRALQKQIDEGKSIEQAVKLLQKEQVLRKGCVERCAPFASLAEKLAGPVLLFGGLSGLISRL
jgi:hypothetical protein